MLFLLFAFQFLLQLPYVIAQSQDSCFLTNNENGLPQFSDRGYPSAGPDSRIHHRHQAIIPSYRLNCCGNITEWGVDLNPDGTCARFNFIFQVWRPAPNVDVTGCYSLVDDFISTNISIGIQPSPTIGVARIIPSLADQLQFQPGDVLGFYVESHGDGAGPGGDANNGVALLTSSSYSSELVWYGSIGTITTQISQTDSCPYPVGGTGALDSRTRAAPVISVSITTYSCHQGLSTLVTQSFSSSPPAIEPAYSSYAFSSRLFSSTSSSINVPAASSLSTPTLIHVPGPVIFYSGLISGIIVSIVMCVSIVMVIIIITIVVAKRHNRKILNHYQTSAGIALSSNQAYAITAPMRVHTNVAYENKPVRKESGMIYYVESVQYHSVGPDTPKSRTSHTYVGDSESDPLENSVVYATADRVGMDTDHAYENTEKNEATPGLSLRTNS